VKFVFQLFFARRQLPPALATMEAVTPPPPSADDVLAYWFGGDLDVSLQPPRAGQLASSEAPVLLLSIASDH